MFGRRAAPQKREWIAIYNPAAIGDSLMTVPLLRHLRQENPGVELHFVAPSAVGALLEEAGEIDLYRPSPGIDRHAVTLNAQTGVAEPVLFTDPLPPREEGLWRTIGKPREIVAFGDETLSERLEPLGVPFSVISLQGDEGEHVARSVLRQYLTTDGFYFAPALVAPLNLEPYRNGRPAVYLHPGASADWKRWPAENFLLLARRLWWGLGARIVFIDAPGQHLLREMNWTGAVLRPASLLDLARRTADALAYVGCDTGTTHLAALSGTQTIALFGPTNSSAWCPLGPRVTVLDRCDEQADVCRHVRGGSSCLSQIEVDDVMRGLHF